MFRKILCILLAAAALCALLTLTASATQGTTDSTNPPYAQIAYDYTPDVHSGTIRYISQITSGSLYCYEYWGDWEWKRIPGLYYGPGSECGTACISMALSYVGVDKTPEDILDYGGGHTFFQDWGDATISKLPVTDFTTAMENYINGNGRYSPPVIHLPNYSARGHYVLVIGKIDAETYEILDPNNCAVTTMKIAEASAQYDVRGSHKNDRIDSLCQWFNPNAAPALIKEIYPSACAVKTTEQIYGMTLPCGSEKNAESQMMRIIEKGTELTTAELILNDWGEYWYKLQSLGKAACYVPASKVAYLRDEPAKITIADASSPDYLTQGEYFSVRGKITSAGHRLTAVAVHVRAGHDVNGDIVLSQSVETNGQVYHLAYSPIDSKLRFGKLTEGKYTYIIETKYVNYHINGDGQLESAIETAALLEKYFAVEAARDQNPPEQPALQIDIKKENAHFTWESVAHTTHYHLQIQKENGQGEWEDVEMLHYTSSGVSRTLPIGSYRAQLIAVNENAWDSERDDWKQTASEEVLFEIVCEHQYAEGVPIREATCKEEGVISYTCSLCEAVIEEAIPKLENHTPGTPATATTDQVCTVCGLVLEKATGETEPAETEATEPATQPPETPEAEAGKDTDTILWIIPAIILLGIGVVAGVTLWKEKHLTPEVKEMQETQS